MTCYSPCHPGLKPGILTFSFAFYFQRSPHNCRSLPFGCLDYPFLPPARFRRRLQAWLTWGGPARTSCSLSQPSQLIPSKSPTQWEHLALHWEHQTLSCFPPFFHTALCPTKWENGSINILLVSLSFPSLCPLPRPLPLTPHPSFTLRSLGKSLSGWNEPSLLCTFRLLHINTIRILPSARLWQSDFSLYQLF